MGGYFEIVFDGRCGGAITQLLVPRSLCCALNGAHMCRHRYTRGLVREVILEHASGLEHVRKLDHASGLEHVRKLDHASGSGTCA